MSSSSYIKVSVPKTNQNITIVSFIGKAVKLWRLKTETTNFANKKVIQTNVKRHQLNTESTKCVQKKPLNNKHLKSD